MAISGSLRDRNRKSGLLSRRTMALVLVVMVAALSFTLGYYAGLSGGQGRGVTEVVPEGAGLVFLGDDSSCPDRSQDPGERMAVLETVKVPLTPEPDKAFSPASQQEGPSGDEPVIEPVGASAGQEAAEPDGRGERRVAPIGQLPKKQPLPDTENEQAEPEPRKKPVLRSEPEKTSPTATIKKPVARKPVPKKPAAQKPVAKTSGTKKTTAVTAKPGSMYSVQVGAFNSLGDARTHKRRFAEKGFKASVYKESTPEGSDIYKVRVGTYTDKAGAAKMARRLKDELGASAFVTVIQ